MLTVSENSLFPFYSFEYNVIIDEIMKDTINGPQDVGIELESVIKLCYLSGRRCCLVV